MIKDIEEKFSLLNLTKGKLPSLPFAMMKEYVLGKSYSLSLVFISEKKSQELNKTYRQKNKPANILSFPYDKKTGEIFICIATAKKQAKDFDRTWEQFIGFLVIHGMLHLKGMEHSSTMERKEVLFSKKFGC
ncbi:MAG: rRNA maturation RNase YbeY [Candidatus Nomurabacteria bacterium]|nr:rRNA maturation RNase YbeY [Candidatus Nomurabacteria bacterium]